MLVVGGSSGIGLALVEALVNLDAEVIIGSRSIENINRAKTLVPKIASAIQVDASDESSVQKFFDKTGDFDHLISTIKPSHMTGDFSECNIADTRHAFEAKFWGQYILTRMCLEKISRSGSITLTSGIASQKYYKGFSGTAAINGAIESFVKSVSAEIAPLRINAVSPGFIARTELDPERFNYVKNLGANIPLQRLGYAKEVVSSYLYLLQNTYSTGTTLIVDGGETCASGA